MTIEEFESISLTVCVTGLCLYMLFIIWRLAKESNAGKFGTFVLFFALGLGILGFAIKQVIQLVLGLE